MIELREVTPENYDAVMALEVAADQSTFVAPVVKSLADAYVYAGEAYAAVGTEGVVGFVLLYSEPGHEAETLNLVRLLVDQKYQGNGYGREALSAVVALARQREPRPAKLRLSVLPANTRAIGLYERFGFAGDEMEDGERVMLLDL